MYGKVSLTVHAHCDRSRDVDMATSLGDKFATLTDPTFIRRTGVPIQIRDRNSDFRW